MADKKEKPVPEKQPNQLLKDFLDKEKLVLIPSPRFVSTNHNTYELEIQVGVRRR